MFFKELSITWFVVKAFIVLSPFDIEEFCSDILDKSIHVQLLRSALKAIKHFPLSVVTELNAGIESSLVSIDNLVIVF